MMRVKLVAPKYLNNKEVLFYQHFFELKKTETAFGVSIVETESPKSDDGRFDLEEIALMASNVGFALIVIWNGEEYEAFIPDTYYDIQMLKGEEG